MRIVTFILLITMMTQNGFSQTHANGVGSQNLPEITLDNPETISRIIAKVLPTKHFDQLQPGALLFTKFYLNKQGKVDSLSFQALPKKLAARDASQTIEPKYLEKIKRCFIKKLRFSIDAAYRDHRWVSLSLLVKPRNK